jgi:ATP-binding cassette subfamily B (MDR/TAP) protein 1
MSLIFGNLTQDFVNFGIALNKIDPNDPESNTKLDQAAKGFRHVAAKDASYLTYIGMSLITLLLLL